MTPQEFFNKVKGKKITWSSWEKGMYFIAESYGYANTIVGKTFTITNPWGYNDSWFIKNGFELSERKSK